MTGSMTASPVSRSCPLHVWLTPRTCFLQSPRLSGAESHLVPHALREGHLACARHTIIPRATACVKALRTGHTVGVEEKYSHFTPSHPAAAVHPVWSVNQALSHY